MWCTKQCWACTALQQQHLHSWTGCSCLHAPKPSLSCGWEERPRQKEAGWPSQEKAAHSISSNLVFQVTFITLLYCLCHLPEKFNSPCNKKEKGAILIPITFVHFHPTHTHTHLHPSTSTDRWEQAAVTLWQQGCTPRCTPRASILLRALPANSTPLASLKRWKTAEAAQQPGSSSVHSCCLSLCLAPCAAGSPCLSPRPRSYCCRHTTNGFPNCILWLCVGFF